MISVNGENEYYYFDIDRLFKEVEGKDVSEGKVIKDVKVTTRKDGDGSELERVIEEVETYSPKEIDEFRYETYRTLINTVVEPPMVYGDGDLPTTENPTLNFTIAFNTLLHKKIIRKI